MGKITIEVYKNTFGTTLYNLTHPNGAVGTFAVVVNFFTIYKLQQANAGMNVVVVHSSEIRGLCLMKWPILKCF